MRVEWTKDKVDRIFDMVDHGVSYKTIGEEFGVTRNTIRTQVERYRPGSTPKRWNFEEEADVPFVRHVVSTKFDKQGISPEEVANIRKTIKPLDRINIMDIVKFKKNIESEMVRKTYVLAKYTNGITVMIDNRLRFYRYDCLKRNDQGVWSIRKFGAYEI